MASAQTSPVVVRFGVFEADLRAGELRRNGAKVRLQDLPFRALALLLSRPGTSSPAKSSARPCGRRDVFVDFERLRSVQHQVLKAAVAEQADVACRGR
jgi:hypothetical protein